MFEIDFLELLLGFVRSHQEEIAHYEGVQQSVLTELDFLSTVRDFVQCCHHNLLGMYRISSIFLASVIILLSVATLLGPLLHSPPLECDFRSSSPISLSSSLEVEPPSPRYVSSSDCSFEADVPVSTEADVTVSLESPSRAVV